eukprot:4245450-Amphidinium_carterae.1
MQQLYVTWREVDANGQPLPQEESRFEQPLPRAILHCAPVASYHPIGLEQRALYLQNLGAVLSSPR